MANTKKKMDQTHPRYLRQTFGGNRISRKQGRKGLTGKRYSYLEAKNILLPAKLKEDAEKKAKV